MGVSAKIATPATGTPTHLRDLRSTLAWLRARGDLVETDKEVNPDLEVTGLQKLMDGGCPGYLRTTSRASRTTRS